MRSPICRRGYLFRRPMRPSSEELSSLMRMMSAHGEIIANSTRDGESIGGVHHAGAQSRKEDAAHYREYAAQLRDLAGGEPDIGLRNRLRVLANRYEALAKDLEPEP